MADCVAGSPRGRGGVAARLWHGLGLGPRRGGPRLLDTALVLLADHEIATSTLAARVAASTRADPFSVVLAGLGALNGPLHGRASVMCQRVLMEAAASGDADRAVADAMVLTGGVPGFGHRLYRGPDPRAVVLLEAVRPLMTASQRALIDGVLAAATRLVPSHPNVDFALAAMSCTLGLEPGATDLIFAIARTAGWIAHAIEEYGEAPLRFRPSAVYTGRPLPG